MALAGCHQLPTVVLSPFTAPVSPEAATTSPVPRGGMVAGAGWCRGSQTWAVEEHGVLLETWGGILKLTQNQTFPARPHVLQHVVLNNSHEEAYSMSLEPSGFPGRSCSWTKSLSNQFFRGMCHSCPHSLLHEPAVTARSRHFCTEISMARGALGAQPCTAEFCSSAHQPRVAAAALPAAVGMPSSQSRRQLPNYRKRCC